MATKEATVQEGAEQVVDGLEEIAAASQGLNKQVLFVGGVIIGVSVGFLIAKKRLEAKIRAEAEEEINAVRDLYFEKARRLDNTKRVVEKKETIQEVMEKAGYVSPTEDREVAEAEAGPEQVALEAEQEPETRNVFHAGEITDWDWDVEKQIREEGHDQVPYVLHRDEYFPNEYGWDQVSLTYFEGDDVLADDHDTPVDDQDAMVGLGNLAKFGHGSGDPNVVYVRNPELNLEIEIIHSDGEFAKQRRGIPIEEPERDEHGRFKPRPEGDPRKRRSRGDR